MNTREYTTELTDVNGIDHEIELTFDIYTEPQTWDEPGGTFVENIYISVDGESVDHGQFRELFTELIDDLVDEAISNYTEPEPEYDDCETRGHFVN